MGYYSAIKKNKLNKNKNKNVSFHSEDYYYYDTHMDFSLKKLIIDM